MPRSTLILSVSVLLLGGMQGTATAQAIDPAFSKDVVKLLEVNGSAAMAQQLGSLMASQLIEVIRKSQPDMPPRVGEIIIDVLRSTIASNMSTLFVRMVPMYAKHFTHDEVTTLLAFYESGVGKKSVALAPIMMQEGSEIGQAWADGLEPGFRAELEKRFKAEGLIK